MTIDQSGHDQVHPELSNGQTETSPAAIKFEINQRPRRQIKHKYIKSTSYVPVVETTASNLSSTSVESVEVDTPIVQPICPIALPVDPVAASKPVRKRGRPRKDALLTPHNRSPIVIDDNSSTSNPTQQLVDAIHDPELQFVEEVVETEHYELLLVEDVSQSASVVRIDSESSMQDTDVVATDEKERSKIVVRQESDDTYVVTVEDEDDSQHPDASEFATKNIYVEVTDSLDNDPVAVEEEVDDSTSQNSTLNSLSGGESEVVYGFDGDQLVCKTPKSKLDVSSDANSFNGAFSKIRKSRRLEPQENGSNIEPSDDSDTPSAVQIAVQQLTMLGVNCITSTPKPSKKRHDSEISLSFGRASAATSNRSNSTANKSGLEQSSREGNLKTNTKSNKLPTTLEKLVKRVTRKNSIVHLPSKSAALRMLKSKNLNDLMDRNSSNNVVENLHDSEQTLPIEPVEDLESVQESTCETKSPNSSPAKMKFISLKDRMQLNLNDLLSKTSNQSIDKLEATTTTNPNSSLEEVNILVPKKMTVSTPKKKKTKEPTSTKKSNSNSNAKQFGSNSNSVSDEQVSYMESLTLSAEVPLKQTRSFDSAGNTLQSDTKQDCQSADTASSTIVTDDILNNITHKKYRRKTISAPNIYQLDENSLLNDLTAATEDNTVSKDSTSSGELITLSGPPKNSDAVCRSHESEKTPKKSNRKADESPVQKQTTNDEETKSNNENSNDSVAGHTHRKSSKSSAKSVHSSKSVKTNDSSENKSKPKSKENKSNKVENQKTDQKLNATNKKGIDNETSEVTAKRVANDSEEMKKKPVEVKSTNKRSRWDSSTAPTKDAKQPEKKMDSYSILSDCYLPKMVKHDASLYSIEAMRAAEDLRSIELKELADAKKAAEQRKIEEAKAAAEAKRVADEARRMSEAMQIVEAMRSMDQLNTVATASPNSPKGWRSPVLSEVPLAKSPIMSKGMLKFYDNGSPMEKEINKIKYEFEPFDDDAKTGIVDLKPKTEPTDAKEEGSPVLKMESTEEESNIRRSGRIKIISETKQRSRGFGLVRDRERFHGMISSGDVSLNSSLEYLDSDSSSVGTLGYVSDLERDSFQRCEPIRTKTKEEIEKEQCDLKEGLGLFEQIIDNEFKSERNISKEAKRMTCDCFLTPSEIERGEFGCGEDCLNRLLMIECGSRCVVGSRCTNKRFQKHQNSDCTIFKTEKKGFGLMANSFIAAGEFVMEYVGEVLNSRQFEHRANEYSKEQNKHYYFMALRSDCVIDATARGNISRFINHSCDPNAETQKWTVNGELRIGFFSTKDIMAGQEITFDYQFQRYG